MGKSQHYVPQFYLRRFSNNSRSIGTWSSTQNKFIEHASIANMASKDNLYGRNQEVEKMFSEIEGRWSKSFHKLVNDGLSSISPEEMFETYLFFVLSKTRTLKMAEQSKSFVDYYIENIKFEDKIQEKKATKTTLSQIAFFTLMDIAAQNIEVLYDLDWTIIQNLTDALFVTSDNPVCMYNKLYTVRNYDRGYGLGSGGIIILLPLSPEKCLCLFDSVVYETGGKNTIEIKTTSQANEINKLLCRNAYRNVYYNNQQKTGHLKVYVKSHKQILATDFVKPYLGPIIKIGGDSIHENFRIDFLQIREEFLNAQLPPTLAGLLRPVAYEIMERENNGDIKAY